MSKVVDHAAARDDRSFFGQPRSLANIFGVEMWERFSFYGMQGILLLYLYFSAADGGLGIPQTTAAGIVGAYGGGVYLATILGAWIADRLLGSERVLFCSAIAIMLGHIALAVVPGIGGLVAGLILVAIGSGGLKANATSVVGTLYAPDAARRVSDPLPRSRWPRYTVIAIATLGVIVVLGLTGMITASNLVTIVIGLTIVGTIAYFVVILTNCQITTVERKRVYAFIPLFIASAAFWSLYQQQFTVVTIYSDERLDRALFGWEMPVSCVQSINPVLIIVLSGIFAALLTRLGTRQPSTQIKFVVGTAVMGGAFLLFLPFAGGAANSTPLLAMIGILLVFTIAELLLSPVGLSVATKLAPEVFKTQMVALFFLSVALGSAVSGVLATWYATAPGRVYFSVLGSIAIVLGLLLVLISRPVLRLMGGVR
ncbi:MFS transporter [Cryobacterium levicorallinum]|uniref:MFS transporter n=1 Tax=Cryobacterium levicorallinum TaxID=995038 RepID=A0A1I3DX82_9MICO|nr:oligopeptide:H+ symporter [Cryobacterium levicorallinum]TFB83965.1 MFS transporter [Cryobacterium levicorallinum]GEP28639.1 MFS transporter [Cryobacterium levicorallinum]SFH91061.1 proton-dependent oligopeptide transporter, POT family [Cryobacterium levicorallinum]